MGESSRTCQDFVGAALTLLSEDKVGALSDLMCRTIGAYLCPHLLRTYTTCSRSSEIK